MTAKTRATFGKMALSLTYWVVRNSAFNRPFLILVPRATIFLTCGRDRELWLCPAPEVHDSRTSRQIWQIWFAENMKRLLCSCSENQVWPELSISATGQKDRGSGDKNDHFWFSLCPCFKRSLNAKPFIWNYCMLDMHGNESVSGTHFHEWCCTKAHFNTGKLEMAYLAGFCFGSHIL